MLFICICKLTTTSKEWFGDNKHIYGMLKKKYLQVFADFSCTKEGNNYQVFVDYCVSHKIKT